MGNRKQQCEQLQTGGVQKVTPTDSSRKRQHHISDITLQVKPPHRAHDLGPHYFLFLP